MTADVNVTEKVARAVFASRLSEGDYPEGTGSWEDIPEDWREFCRTLATAALAVLSDPEVLAGMAGVLREHMARPTGSPHCKCAWRPALSLNDTESDRQQHRDHQATALADWLRGQG